MDKKSRVLKFVILWMSRLNVFFTFYCNQFFIDSGHGLEKIIFCLHNSWKLTNILFSTKFGKIFVSENNIDINIIVQIIENYQCVYGHPNKPLQKEEIGESSVLVF